MNKAEIHAKYRGHDLHEYADLIPIADYNDPIKRAAAEQRALRAMESHGDEHTARGEPDEQIAPDSIVIDWITRGDEDSSMMLFCMGYCTCADKRRKENARN